MCVVLAYVGFCSMFAFHLFNFIWRLGTLEKLNQYFARREVGSSAPGLVTDFVWREDWLCRKAGRAHSILRSPWKFDLSGIPAGHESEQCLN